jgi:hypothetical protein
MVARPNGIHESLAHLAVEGAFVATTNFDLAIESAAASQRLLLPDRVPLHLHGRADDPASLVHTIRAVGRGLPDGIDERFAAGLRAGAWS